MNKLNIRTTYDNNAICDSHEIRAYGFKLLATKYNQQASRLKVE